jgi:hypothetical protein
VPTWTPTVLCSLTVCMPVFLDDHTTRTEPSRRILNGLAAALVLQDQSQRRSTKK